MTTVEGPGARVDTVMQVSEMALAGIWWLTAAVYIIIDRPSATSGRARSADLASGAKCILCHLVPVRFKPFLVVSLRLGQCRRLRQVGRLAFDVDSLITRDICLAPADPLAGLSKSGADVLLAGKRATCLDRCYPRPRGQAPPTRCRTASLRSSSAHAGVPVGKDGQPATPRLRRSCNLRGLSEDREVGRNRRPAISALPCIPHDTRRCGQPRSAPSVRPRGESDGVGHISSAQFTSAELSRSFGAPPLMNAFFLRNGKASAYRACRSCLAKGLLWGEKVPPRFVHSLEGL